MLIRFSKRKGAFILTCTRADGTSTFAKPRQAAFFAAHDLLHYAVETTLGLRQSFFGLIAAGRSIDSFSDPGIAAALPAEAILTEFIVGQLQQELAFDLPTDAESFNRMLAASIEHAQLSPARPLTSTQLESIRALHEDLTARFAALEDKDDLQLDFSGQSSRSPDSHVR